MYRNMEQWSEIRRRVLVDGVSRRQILRETGSFYREGLTSDSNRFLAT